MVRGTMTMKNVLYVDDLEDYINENRDNIEKRQEVVLALEYMHSGKSLPETCQTIIIKKLMGMNKALSIFDKIVVNQAGGYCGFDPKRMEIICEEFVEKYSEVHKNYINDVVNN